MKIRIETPNAPKALGPYSQGVVAYDGMIFTSGQIPLTPQGVLLKGPIAEQCRQIMRNLDAVLRAAGASFKDVIKATIYVTDMSDYGKINDVYGSYFSEPFPARETVCVKELPLGAKLEISMVAVKP